jgi:hypothetical protein
MGKAVVGAPEFAQVAWVVGDVRLCPKAEKSWRAGIFLGTSATLGERKSPGRASPLVHCVRAVRVQRIGAREHNGAASRAVPLETTARLERGRRQRTLATRAKLLDRGAGGRLASNVREEEFGWRRGRWCGRRGRRRWQLGIGGGCLDPGRLQGISRVGGLGVAWRLQSPSLAASLESVRMAPWPLAPHGRPPPAPTGLPLPAPTGLVRNQGRGRLAPRNRLAPQTVDRPLETSIGP